MAGKDEDLARIFEGPRMSLEMQKKLGEQFKKLLHDKPAGHAEAVAPADTPAVPGAGKGGRAKV